MHLFHVRLYRDSDWAEWLRMTSALFPRESRSDLAVGMRDFLQRDDAAVFAAEVTDGSLAGYVQVGERPYADGCDTSPVAFIEEWYVEPQLRRNGIGRSLLRAAETWALARGHREMASDALLENTLGHLAHGRAGYEEVERAVRFRKVLRE